MTVNMKPITDLLTRWRTTRPPLGVPLTRWWDKQILELDKAVEEALEGPGTYEDKFHLSIEPAFNCPALICGVDPNGCRWFMSFPQDTAVLTILQALDDHMRTNHNDS